MLLFVGQIRQGTDPGRGKNMSRGHLLQTERLQRQTECIAMIYKHVGRSVVTFGSISKSNFLCVSDVFLDFVILAYFNVISIDFYAVKCISAFILCNFHVSKWDNAHIKDLNAWRFLMNFLCTFCIYLNEGRGCTNACICIGTHNQPFLQNRLMDVYATWLRWSTHGHAPVYRLFG